MASNHEQVTIGRRGTGLSPFVQVFGPQVMDRRISDAAYRTLHLLDLLGGADREGHHRIALIAKMRGVSIRSLQYHLKNLKDAGAIEIEYANGETNRIYIIEPLDMYGRETIGGFYGEVQKTRATLCSSRKETQGVVETMQDIAPPPCKILHQPRKNLAPHKTLKSNASPTDKKGLRRARKTGVDKGVEEKEKSPTGAGSHPPESRKAGNEKGPMKAEGKRGAAAGWASAAPFTSPGETQTVCASGSGRVMPWEREEEAEGLKRRGRKKGVKKKGLYDPDKPVSEWNGNDLVGYFRERFKQTFPGEGAPDVRIEDLGAAKRRITWMQNEGMDIGLAKQAVDHLFASWGNGLPGRLRWKGSRPGMALIETARFFETLVREVQSGVPSGGTADEYRVDEEMDAKYAKRDEICARLVREGKKLEEAGREADRLAGL